MPGVLGIPRAAPGGGVSNRVLVHHAVAGRFDGLADRCRGQPEQGGILLGAYRKEGLEVVGLTEAAPADERALTRFVRQDPAHQAAATAAWRQSGGQLTMIGEWHTHPFGEPEPSSTDLGTWGAAVRRSRLPLLFVIVAPGRWRAFSGTRRLMILRLARLGAAVAGEVGLLLSPEGERK